MRAVQTDLDCSPPADPPPRDRFITMLKKMGNKFGKKLKRPHRSVCEIVEYAINCENARVKLANTKSVVKECSQGRTHSPTSRPLLPPLCADKAIISDEKRGHPIIVCGAPTVRLRFEGRFAKERLAKNL